MENIKRETKWIDSGKKGRGRRWQRKREGTVWRKWGETGKVRLGISRTSSFQQQPGESVQGWRGWNQGKRKLMRKGNFIPDLPHWARPWLHSGFRVTQDPRGNGLGVGAVGQTAQSRKRQWDVLQWDCLEGAWGMGFLQQGWVWVLCTVGFPNCSSPRTPHGQPCLSSPPGSRSHSSSMPGFLLAPPAPWLPHALPCKPDQAWTHFLSYMHKSLGTPCNTHCTIAKNDTSFLLICKIEK